MPKAVRVEWTTTITHADTFLVPDDFDLADWDVDALWGHMFEQSGGLPEDEATEVDTLRVIEAVCDAE